MSDKRRRWLRIGGVLGAIVIAGWVGLRLWAASAGPPETLGLTEGRLAPCPGSPNCVNSTDDDPEHAIPPFQCPVDDPISVLAPIVEELPRTTIETRTDRYLHAVARTRLIGFKDDLELHATDDVVHVRSASRLGEGDLGVNRDRVEELRGRVAEAGVCR